MRGAFPSERWPLAERFAELLATDGVTRGLIGPREVPRLWSRHLANSAALADAVPDGVETVCDIGSGAGLPGVVLALRRPDFRVTLVEPLLRRTTFLDEVVAELRLENVEVVRARAEELHGARTFDVVTSRAVAPLPRLLAWSMPLVAPRGQLLAMKGAKAEEEIAGAGSALAAWGCGPATVHTVGSAWITPPTTVVRVAWADPNAVRLHPKAASGSSSTGARRSGRRKRGR